MPHPRPLPLELAISPFRVRDARERGVTPRRLRAQDLHAPFHGVRTLVAPVDVLARCRAYAAKMPPEHYFSHVTAARLWGLPLPRALEADPSLHVSTAGREPHGRGIRGHRIGGGRDIRFIDALPVLAPSETWCQLASLISLDSLIAAGDRLLGWPMPLADDAEVDAAIRAYGARRGARRIALARPEMRPRSASARETRLRLLVVRAGYPEPEPNGRIGLPSGDETHGDLVFRSYRVVLEYDGEQHRTDRRQFRRDVDRLNAIARAGWHVIRVHAEMPSDVILDLLDDALRRSGWRQ